MQRSKTNISLVASHLQLGQLGEFTHHQGKRSQDGCKSPAAEDLFSLNSGVLQIMQDAWLAIGAFKVSLMRKLLQRHASTNNRINRKYLRNKTQTTC
jgi:hypothetical protein